MDIGDNKLKTNLASIGFKQALGMEMGTQAMSVFAGTQSTDAQEGRVLQLLNMVTAEELIDNDEYEGKHNLYPWFHHTTNTLQKFAKTFKKSARSMDKF